MTGHASPAKILVTGGTGYIGSHTCVVLIDNGFEPIVVDNLCNSNLVVLDRIATITGHRPAFYEADIRDTNSVGNILREHEIAAVMHFAGLKAVGESVGQPLRYYRNNVEGSLKLCQTLHEAGVRRFLFSSSATIYGMPDTLPIHETAPIRPTNPYGHTKAFIEQILQDLHHANPEWRMGLLRYFNPVGAHESGLIGEDPKGMPNNLMPFISQVAAGRREFLSVFGNDYPTPDGTGIRDYIHVMDLAEAHVSGLEHLFRNEGLFTVNVGTGRGYSVIEVVKAFERASGLPVPYRIVARRPGDIAACYADVTRSREMLGWKTRRNLEHMCADAWRWQSSNPHGYDGSGK